VIGLDTNVLVRYLVRDDPHQTAVATRLIESKCTADEPGRLTLVVLCELVWVLGRGYEYERPAIAGLVRRMLSAEDLQVERSELAWQALNLYEEGKADFADYLIGVCNKADGAQATFTFDRRTKGSGLFQVLS
jgi:predicted nucleic-acid-binding protein